MVAAILGLFLLGGRALSGSIVAPLRATTAMLKDIAQGEGDLTRRLEIHTTDETGELASWFNCFVDKIHGSMRHIATSSSTLSASADGLSETSVELAGGAEVVAAQSTTVATATEQASANVTSISAAAEEMSTSVGAIAAALEEMTASLNQVAHSCQKECSIATAADENAHATQAIMERLGETAGKVGKVVVVIKSIADQTNLLAMNARIEAASAGAAGKGFAVVANEVKELANQTARATVEIGAQIQDMQQTTGSAVKAIVAIANVIAEVSAISQSIVHAVEQQAATVNEIARNMAGAQSSATSIARNVTESARGLSEISSNISGVSKASAGTSHGVVRIQTSSKELVGLATGLATIVKQFRI